MAKVKLQSKWKRFIAIVLAVLTSVAAVFGIVKLGVMLSSDTKEISPSFKRGALDVNGKYVDTNDSIVTKELFECQGLKITPDFDSTVSYQVFYYDQDQTYLECSEVQESAFSYTPVLAKYASVVITPDVDEDGARAFHDLADRINGDRRAWIGKGEFDYEQKSKMQVRNLGDTAAAALGAAMRGGDVKAALKQGIETANDIEEGKVRQGFFGKLFKK